MDRSEAVANQNSKFKIQESYRRTGSRVWCPVFSSPALSSAGASARSVAATCSAWDRVIAGATPAALTSLVDGLWLIVDRPETSASVAINSQLSTINQRAAVAEHRRHPSSKRNDAGGNPAGSTIFGVTGV